MAKNYYRKSLAGIKSLLKEKFGEHASDVWFTMKVNRDGYVSLVDDYERYSITMPVNVQEAIRDSWPNKNAAYTFDTILANAGLARKKRERHVTLEHCVVGICCACGKHPDVQMTLGSRVVKLCDGCVEVVVDYLSSPLGC